MNGFFEGLRVKELILLDLLNNVFINGLENRELPRLVIRRNVGAGIRIGRRTLNESKGPTPEDEQQDEWDKEQPA